MADCACFVGEWRIIEVENYDEKIGDIIKISLLSDGKYEVSCENHPKLYPAATCVDGKLEGDENSYTIELLIKFTAGGPLASGSWTAEDYRKPEMPPER